MTTEQRYYDRGASAAREDIDEGNACRVEDIDEGAVLAHLGLDDNGMETRAILADAAYRADDGEYADDGAELLEAARAAALRGYRDAMACDTDLAQIEAAQAILRAAPRVTLGDMEVCDLLSYEGEIPALPVAAAHAGLAYVVETPSRPGVPATCVLGGATTPRAVRVFAELARDAFVSELPYAPTLAEHRSAGAARDGVYEPPEHGFAGVYLPAEVFRESLRCEALRLLAELILGSGAFGLCLMLAAEHATAGAGAVREMTDVRRAVRDAMRRAYEMGAVHG